MRGYRRRAAATGAAVFVLTGSAMFGGAGTAAAETKTAPCGGTVTAAPGDRIVGVTPLGLRLDLGLVTEGVGALLDGLCKVTVNVVDTATAPLPGGEQAGDAVGGVVGGTTKAAGDVVNRAGAALSGSGGNDPAPAAPPADPAPKSPPAERSGSGDPAPAGTDGGTNSGQPRTVPAPNSPVLGGAALPGAAWLGYTTGWAPMRDYTGIPMATPGLFSVSPGVRYGGQIPGYSPEFGILGQSQDGGQGSDNGVRNAGSADALPSEAGDRPDGATLPMLLAVLALSGVTAALVRTWVLRATS